MIDSHCHLNFNLFKDDWREVLKRSFDNGITNIINIGSNYKTSERAVNIAKEFPQCFAAIGLHPIHVADEKFELEKYISLIRVNSRIVRAVGETGLDYFHQPVDTELQKNVFLKHLDLAKEFNLPVILHCRGAANNPLEAYHDLLEIIPRQSALTPYRTCSGMGSNPRESANGVLHCFSANWQIAQEFLDLGFYIGLTGIITYKNCGQDLLEVVEKTPLEKILIETDAPYLAPEPYRGQRCEPWYVKFTAQKIAAIKKITLEKVIEQTTKNAKELFKIGVLTF